MGVYELLWGIGVVVLLLALAWGVARYRSRNRANDQIAEQATHELYTDPEHYDEKRAELERKLQKPR
jgi:hypothetical protein